MKKWKHIITAFGIGLALVTQLMNPISVRADDGATPEPSQPPAETSTTMPTDVPTEAAPTQSATPEEPSATPPPTEASLNTPAPAATDTVTDGTATNPPTASATPTPEPVDSSTPASSTETDLPTEPSVATVEPDETNIPDAAPVTPEPNVAEVLQQLPADTTVVVLNQNGQPLPLVTQEAADTLANGDPVWCPAGQVPTPGINGCTASYATMNDLLNGAGTNINAQNVDGIIWITSGNIGDVNPIVMDGTVYTNWANYALTLQGGWSGINGDSTINSNSTFTVPISIINWNNNITVNNLNIDHASATGLSLDTKRGHLKVTNTNSRNNLGLVCVATGGCYVTNANGLNATTNGGNIDIDNSSFDGNWGSGASIMTNGGSATILNSHFDTNGDGSGMLATNIWGGITIAGSTFDGNYMSGASINGASNIDVASSSFNDNSSSHGLYVTNTIGNITLASITATANSNTSGDGAYLDNTSGSGNITLTGINDFSNHNPWNSGMYILSNGDVNLDGITSNNNGRGVNISQAANATITNGNFNNNHCGCEGSGAYVIATGDVTIDQSNLVANNLYINNQGNVNIYGTSIDQALGFGLGVETSGNVTIDNSSITKTLEDGNLFFPWGDGADIFMNGGTVTITGSRFAGNTFDGLYIDAPGDVTVDQSAFNENLVGGLDIADQNTLSVSSSEFTANAPYYDLFASCGSEFLSLIFDDSPDINAPALIDFFVANSCAFSNYHNTASTSAPQPGHTKNKVRIDSSGHNSIPSGSHVEFYLCFDPDQKNQRVNLPNGDKVEIICPVAGKASISRLDNTTLPGELPAGFTFASAFEVKISQLLPDKEQQQRSFIDVITQAGYIKASFVAPSAQAGDTYSILYWDNGTWIPLKDFMLDPNGLPHTFPLHSDQPDDPKKIIKGVEYLPSSDQPRVEVSVNFPGIFVLAIH